MKLYLFDFDGTISETDSMIEFFKYIHGIKFYFILIKSIPSIVKFKLNIISKKDFKNTFILHFLHNLNEKQIGVLSDEFANYYIKNLKISALDYIKKLKEDKQNHITIVSASLDIWIKPIARIIGVNYICTLSKFKNNLFIGINGENCWGKNKVSRIKEIYHLESYSQIYAFGDSSGDMEMLDLATNRHFNFFV